MTKKVLVTISGLQFMDAEDGERQDDAVEVTSPADYFYKNGKHYIIYDEVTEGFTGHTKNQIKISDGPVVEVKKSGLVNSVMTFESGNTHMTCYQTPFGQMMMGVTADHIEIQEEDNRIDIHISYELDVNYEPMAECRIHICVEGRLSLIHI